MAEGADGDREPTDGELTEQDRPAIGTTDGGDRVLANGELLANDRAEDRAAIGWALSTNQPLFAAIFERIRSGGHNTTVSELAAVRQAWEQADRPAPQHHVHRTRVVFHGGAA